MVWNESCDPKVDPQLCRSISLFAGSGGPSNCSDVTWTPVGTQIQITCNAGYPKPSWQAGPNVPSDGVRDLPDVSLTAAGGHDGYLVCIEGYCQSTVVNGQTVLTNAVIVGGTSASSPSMAGLMALVEQQNGQYQGQANYRFYQLAAAQQDAQCNSSNLVDPTQPSACIFNDTTAGNNSVPGQTGFDAAAGYDMATGLGSVNAANLVSNWNNGRKLDTETFLASDIRRSQHGQPITIDGRVHASRWAGTPSGDVALRAGDNGFVSSLSLTQGAFTGAVNDLPGGRYLVTAHYNGDGMFEASDSNPVPVDIEPEDSTVTVQPYNLNLVGFWIPTMQPVLYGTSTGLQIDVQGVSGIGKATGSITIQDGSTVLGTVPIEAGTVWVPLDPLLTQSLDIGAHTFTVSYSGDSSFHASSSQAAITIIKGFPNFTRVVGDATSVPAGTQVELNLVVLASGTEVPSGTVQLYDNGVAVGGPITLNTNVPKGDFQASYIGTFSVGSHQLRIGYSGDSRLNPVDPNSFRSSRFFLTVTAPKGLATNTQISQPSAAIIVGQSQTYTVVVSPATAGGATPTGTVTLTGPFGSKLAAAAPLINGSASIVVPWSAYLGIGAQQLVAQYSGDATYSSSISPQIWTTINPATPAVSLAANGGFVLPGAVSNLTVTVQPTLPLTDPKLGLPFGEVQFYDSVNGAPAQPLGAVQSLTRGNGNITTLEFQTSLPAGLNVITVQYFGSPTGQWGAANSNPVTVLAVPGQRDQDQQARGR